MKRTWFTLMLCQSIIAVSVTVLLSLPCNAVPADNLGAVIAYPNPYNPTVSAANAVTFDNLTIGGIRLRIFNLAGQLIYDRQMDSSGGIIQWGVVDNDNNPAASGLYLYIVTNGAGQKAKGKIAVIK